MRLLLDTHILVWLAAADSRLSPELALKLRQPEVQLVVSAASIWELSIKFHLGKLPSAKPILQDVDGFARRLGADFLNITPAHVIRAGALEWTHRDPFDRLLVAQALEDGLKLVSVDGNITGYAGANVFL